MRKRVFVAIAKATKERVRRKGTATQERFLEAMTAPGSSIVMPPWVTDVFLTKDGGEEDRDLIDAVVLTTMGKFFIQIKSSEWGAAQHFKKFTRRNTRKRFIGVIVIRKSDTLDQIRTRTRSILEDIRTKLPPGARIQDDE